MAKKTKSKPPTLEQRIKKLEEGLAALNASVSEINTMLFANAEAMNNWTPKVAEDLKTLFDAVNKLGKHALEHRHELAIYQGALK